MSSSSPKDKISSVPPRFHRDTVNALSPLDRKIAELLAEEGRIIVEETNAPKA